MKKTTTTTTVHISGVDIYQAMVVKHALTLYALTGVQANSAYTPKNMMAMASKITGETFKPRDYMGAAKALENWRRAASCIMNG